MINLRIKEYIDKKGITRYEVAKRMEIEFSVIDRYYKNTVVRYDSHILNKICMALGCDLSDIIEYVPDESVTPQ